MSVKDEREGLLAGFRLCIKEESGNFYNALITGELGRGLNCIVYRARLSKCIEGSLTESELIIKELFPKGLSIKRRSSGSDLIIPENRKNEYNELRRRFGKRFITYSEYAKSSEGSPFNISIYGEANNTVYACLYPVRGRILSKADVTHLTLNEIARIMESVCRSLRPLHAKEKLHLDIKPANILFILPDDGLNALTYIIDFDTVQKIGDIRQGISRFFPYTPLWAAPEQCVSGDGLYTNPSLIGYHTDIYLVGELLFFLLTGRPPAESDLSKINAATFTYDYVNAAARDASDEAARALEEVLKRTLEPDPIKRRLSFKDFLSIRELEKCFAYIYGLTAGDNLHFEPLQDRLSSLESEMRLLREELRALKKILDLKL